MVAIANQSLNSLVCGMFVLSVPAGSDFSCKQGSDLEILAWRSLARTLCADERMERATS